MNKLLVLAKNKETYFIKKLIKELGHERIILYNPWKDHGPSEFINILVRTSGIYGDSKDLDFLHQAKVPILNPLSSLEIFRSKSSQYKFFDLAHHPCALWCSIREKDFLNWQTDLFLVKPDFGQGGWGIEVLSGAALNNWIKEKKIKGDLSWIIQPYLKASEYRIFFIGDERFCLKRMSSGKNVAANFAADGEARLVKLPEHLTDMVEKLIKTSQAYYGAIDLLDHAKGPVFLELNVVPGIEQLEALTHHNVIQILVSAKFFCQQS